MHDPKFEKDVQQKMEELNLIPSENVWENVEKEIRKEKKRRVPVFWFFLAGGLLLVGGIYFIPDKPATSPLAAATSRSTGSVTRSKDEPHSSSGNAGAGGSQSNQPVNPEKGESVISKTDRTDKTDSKDQTKNAETIETIKNAAGTNRKIGETGRKIGERDRKIGETNSRAGTTDKEIGKTVRPNKTPDVVVKDHEKRRLSIVQKGRNDKNAAAEKAGRKSRGVAGKAAGGQEVSGSGSAGGATEAGATAEPAATTQSRATAEPGAATQSAIGAQPLTTTKPGVTPPTEESVQGKAGKQPGKPEKRENSVKTDSKIGQEKKIPHRWKIGLTAGGGLAGVDRSLFKAASVAQVSSFASTFAAFPPGWQNPGPSTIRPGPSFAAGVFASRRLSRKLSFSIGLNYHYFSTNIHTGPEIKYATNMPSPNLSLMSPTLTSSRYAQTTTYSMGDEGLQKGQYHLLELPVSVQWQFAKIRNLPLYWENGFAVSSLIGVNALHYDGTSGVYYKDNSLFRKMQTSISTAVLAGFPLQGHSMLVGPQIEYGLSGLLKNNIGEQHLFFGGIKAVFMLGR